MKKNLALLQQWARGDARPVQPQELPDIHEKVVGADEKAFDSGCAGKEAYGSRKAALAAQVYREREGVGSGGMTAYHCRFCYRWHLGHAKPR